MRTNKLKVFSYPYLADFSSDYESSSFTINVTPSANGKKLGFQIQYQISNATILEQISSGKLRIVARLACSAMGFVEIARFDAGNAYVTMTANPLEVDGDVDIVAYLISNVDVSFSNPDLSKEWINQPSFVLKGNVIGESNVRTVTVHHPGDGSKASIFRWVPNLTAQPGDPFIMDLSGNRIVFKVAKEQMTQFQHLQAKSEPLIITSFLVPAFSEILANMSETTSDSDVEGGISAFNSANGAKGWYKRILAKYENVFGSEPNNGDKDPVFAAQKLLGNPVPDMLNYGIKAEKRGSEDE